MTQTPWGEGQFAMFKRCCQFHARIMDTAVATFAAVGDSWSIQQFGSKETRTVCSEIWFVHDFCKLDDIV